MLERIILCFINLYPEKMLFAANDLEARSYSVAQVGLSLEQILLPLSFKTWDYRCEPPVLKVVSTQSLINQTKRSNENPVSVMVCTCNPASKRLRQKDGEFQASLGYIASYYLEKKNPNKVWTCIWCISQILNSIFKRSPSPSVLDVFVCFASLFWDSLMLSRLDSISKVANNNLELPTCLSLSPESWNYRLALSFILWFWDQGQDSVHARQSLTKWAAAITSSSSLPPTPSLSSFFPSFLPPFFLYFCMYVMFAFCEFLYLLQSP